MGPRSYLAQIVERGPDNCRMRMVDLTSKAHNGDAAFALGAWVEHESVVPFEPYRTPPVRAYLARLAEDDHAVLILMHHVRPPRDAAPLPALPGSPPVCRHHGSLFPQPCCGLMQVQTLIPGMLWVVVSPGSGYGLPEPQNPCVRDSGPEHMLTCALLPQVMFDGWSQARTLLHAHRCAIALDLACLLLCCLICMLQHCV